MAKTFAEMTTEDWNIIAQRIAIAAGVEEDELINIDAENIDEQLAGSGIEASAKEVAEMLTATDEAGEYIHTYTGDDIYTDTGPFSRASMGGFEDGEEDDENEEDDETDEDESDLDENDLLMSTLKSTFINALLSTGLDTTTITELWDWAEKRFLEDPTFNAGQAMLEMVETSAFKTRFPAIAEMREANKAAALQGGQAPYRTIPTPAEYLSREKLVSTLFVEHGMDKLPYNIDHVVSESFKRGISGSELMERTTMASKLIYQSPEAIKTAAEKYWGLSGDAALMAAFLDPDDTIFGTGWQSLQSLKTDIATAEVGGWSQMFLDLDNPLQETQAKAIAELGLTSKELWAGLKSVKAEEALFLEKAGERDLTMETHGLAAEFGVDYGEESGQQIEDLLEQRAEERRAEFSGGGGAVVTSTMTGLGSANA
tara:strand:+ start:3034 stop:4317 length:1284 start_codon:yes stop_codon:yes gene_type:complete